MTARKLDPVDVAKVACPNCGSALVPRAHGRRHCRCGYVASWLQTVQALTLIREAESQLEREEK